MCAEDTPLPVLVCKALADAGHAETLATDRNPLQFGHWGPPGCCLSADRHRSCVPQTPQAHPRAVCAEDTPLPAPVCKAVADARHAETPATDGNPLQFGHWGPSGGLGVSEGHSSDAYRHSDGTQCLNCRGFPSVTGVSACLMYVKTIAKEHPKYNSKQPKYTRSIAEVYPRCSRSTAEHYGRRTRPKYSQSVYCKCTLAIGALVEIPLKYIQSISEV